MRSWSGRQRLAAIAAAFALIVGTTLVVVGWRLHHGWLVLEQSERVASYRIDTVDVRRLVFSDVLRQWRQGAWWPDWSYHHHSLRLVGDGGPSLVVDENGERLFLMRSGARRLPAEVDGITFAAYPDVLLVLPGLTAGAVLVDSYSGGAHCCSSIQLIDLDPGKPSVRWWKELGNDGALVIDADGDGVPEILTGDDGFAYWERYSYAESPRTAVILRWNGSTFVPDTGRLLPADAQMISSTMAKRGRETPERALAAWLFALRTKGALGQEFIPPAVVTQLLLDLIYRGRGDLAHAWLLAHWPNSLDRWEFIRHFSTQLENCRFFPATDALTPLEHRWPR